MTTRAHAAPARAAQPQIPDTLAFTTVTGAEGFRGIETEWAEVLAGIEQPHFFQRREWFASILDAWPEIADALTFIVVSRGGRAVAICPLQLQRTRRFGLSVNVLAPPDPNDVAYSGLIAPAGLELGTELLRYLRGGGIHGWDLIELPRTWAATDTCTPGSDFAAWFGHARGVCYYFDCSRGMAAISARISSGLRKHMRRCRRQIADIGDMRFVTSRNTDELPALLDEFLALEASGWKGSAGERTAIALHRDLVRFYTSLLERFARTGECEINLLRVDDRAIAGQFCLMSGGTWYHLKIAYDEEQDRVSPGFVLLEEVLERLTRDDSVHTANFLTGAAWADRWHPDEIPVMRLVARNGTVAGRLALHEIRARRFVRESIIPRLRRFARSGSTSS